MATEKYTPTQKRLLTVLADGMSHTSKELSYCIGDELADMESTVRVHLSNLRKLLPRGQDILSKKRPDGEWGYSHVRVVKITGE